MGLLVVVLLLSLSLQALATEVDEDCKKSLTELDPHMSKYVGKTYTIEGTHDNQKTYTYTLGICNTVDITTNVGGCAVVQTDSNGNNNSTSFCIGSVNKAQIARSSDGVWIELTYAGGEQYGHHCNGVSRTARIVFLCDPNVKGMSTPDFLEENKDDDLCYYLFSMASEAVCGYIPGDSLSAGDIILIICACLVALWMAAMLGGFLYKRFMVGAKGWEQVPLYDMYREFGNLQADGCDLVCRSRQRKVPIYHEPTFGADTDESDEEKDDNLLPM